MIKLKYILLCFFVALISSNAYSAETVEDVYEKWKMQISKKLIEKCEQEGLDVNEDVSCDFHSNVSYGIANVKLDPKDPKWVDARSMAYTEALVDAYSRIAQTQSLTNSVKLVKELLDDQTPLDANDLKSKASMDSKLDVLLNKTIAIAGGKMDKELRELGINPEQYDSAPVEKRKTLLKSAITQRSVAQALADTTGMIPLQTFEGADINGKYEIRVAVSTSPERIALVKSMLRDGAMMPADETKKSPKTIEEQVVVSKDLLVNQFGVRLLRDKSGYPVLVAFGQAGVPATKGAAQSIKMESARKTATANARSYLTNLLRSSTFFKEITEQIASYNQDMKLIAGNDGISQEMIEQADYVEKLDNSTTTTAQISNFAGVREIYSWSHKHPKYGHTMVGTILMWSPKTARHINEKKNAHVGQNVHVPNTASTEISSVTTGMELDDYDF